MQQEQELQFIYSYIQALLGAVSGVLAVIHLQPCEWSLLYAQSHSVSHLKALFMPFIKWG